MCRKNKGLASTPKRQAGTANQPHLAIGFAYLWNQGPAISAAPSIPEGTAPLALLKIKHNRQLDLRRLTCRRDCVDASLSHIRGPTRLFKQPGAMIGRLRLGQPQLCWQKSEIHQVLSGRSNTFAKKHRDLPWFCRARRRAVRPPAGHSPDAPTVCRAICQRRLKSSCPP